MKKILVPCDFSMPAIEALRFAIDIASASGGSVKVLKVIELPVLYENSLGLANYNFESGLMKELQDDGERKYKKIMQKYGKGFERISFSIIHGRVAQTIRDYATEKRFDLVVMGTHGASGLTEFLVGSNAEKVVRLSPVPVFAIRSAVSVKSIKDIVFATDLHYNQRDFIGKLKALQEFFKAKLHVLFLNTPMNFVSEIDMNAYAQHYKLSNFTLNIRNHRYEADGIITFVNEVKADMLAMPTHARKGLAHFILGSITEDVVNHVQCPVWTYRLTEKK
jgi:nucleotide-binding universal stress UspA family protein